MPRFVIRDLGAETQNMHNHQKVWKRANWHKTLTKHGDQIEQFLDKLNILSIWLTRLHGTTAASELIPEIWMDGYVSISFAGTGLYKYANMSLRSSLETALRLVYFSNHPVEFNWWKEGSRWYKDYQWNFVWGKQFEYFKHLDVFSKFESICMRKNRSFLKENLPKLYGSLSESIHTRARRFQTSTERFSPQYTVSRIKKWFGFYTQTQRAINVLFVLGFPTKFEQMQIGDRERILNVGIDDYYKAEVLEAIGVQT